MRPEERARTQQLRRWRIRKKVMGSSERPRMAVCFTQKNIYVQFVDDNAGVTLVSTSTRSKTLTDRDKLSANVTTAKRIGQLAAELAKARGIEKVVFDRSGARYHGKVKELADAARQAGLKF